MKKLIGIVAAAALLASAAFAELSISGGAGQLWSPVAYNGGDVMTGIQNPWGGGRTASVGFTWVSEDEKAGTSLVFVYDPWVTGIGPDGARVIWAKPWDFLKLSLGHWDGLGNDISATNTASWNWIRPETSGWNIYDENEETGALIELTPVENLWVVVGLPFGGKSYKKTATYEKNDDGTYSSDDGDFYTEEGSNNDLSYHMFEALNVDVKYTISDILGIMVGWRGGRADRADIPSGLPYKSGSDFANVGEVDVLLNLLAVENLQLDVGARINIYDADKVKSYDPFKTIIGVLAGYDINDKFSVKADFAVMINEVRDPSFKFGVGVGVGLTDSLTLDADFRGYIIGDKAGVSSDPIFSFLVGLNYACSTNANIGIGFQGQTRVDNAFGDLGLSANNNFAFAVPICLSVNF